MMTVVDVPTHELQRIISSADLILSQVVVRKDQQANLKRLIVDGLLRQYIRGHNERAQELRKVLQIDEVIDEKIRRDRYEE